MLTGLLLVTTTGVTLNKHYCMGRLKAIAINETANPCDQDGLPIQMPCCEDVAQELKVEEITSVGFEIDLQPELYLLVSHDFLVVQDLPIESQETFDIPLANPPPPKRDFQTTYQVFLI